MFQALYEYELIAAAGQTYRPRAYGEMEMDGLWSGWLVFFPVESGRTVVSTARETTQSTLAALLDWATGLSPAYLEGALERALSLRSGTMLESEIAELERIEDAATTQAEMLERAAAVAHRVATVAAQRRAEVTPDPATPEDRRDQEP